MSRVIVIIASVLAVTAGVLQTFDGCLWQCREDVAKSEMVWIPAGLTADLASEGLEFGREISLTRGGSHKGIIFEHPSRNCSSFAIALDPADEILPLVRQRVQPAVMASAELWFGNRSMPLPDATWKIHFQALLARLGGKGPDARPVLLLRRGNCDARAS